VKTRKINFESKILKHVSNEGKDLLKKLLERNPKKRISASEALEHPWIKHQATKAVIKKEDAKNVFNNIQNFCANIKLQEAAIIFMVNQLVTNDKIKDLKKFLWN